MSATPEPPSAGPTPLPVEVLAAARQALDLVARRAPTLGGARLLCIDGPAGSGKTTLAAAVAALEPASAVVHLDDLYDGWEGLSGVASRLDPLLLPLAEGTAGRYERYDWHLGRFDGWVGVDPTPLLVVEGVGAGARRHAGRRTALVWVEVDDNLRLRRGLERDGEALRHHWDAWVRSERAHFLDEDTRASADMVV